MVKIGGYILDASIKEGITYETEVTAYPVETGSDITDNSHNLPPVLTVEFLVSDSPIGEVAKARGANVVPSSEAKDFLLALRAGKEPFTVECSLGTFDDMVFETLEFPRDAETGAALIGSATFKRIEIREVRRTVVKTRLGRRPSRSVPGKSMWLCPEGTREAPGDDDYNAAQGCKKVVFKDGAPNFEDGSEFSTYDLTQLNAQADDDDEFAMAFDRESWTDANPNGQWVYSKPQRPGLVSKKYAAFPGANNQRPDRTPFEIFDDSPREPANALEQINNGLSRR